MRVQRVLFGGLLVLAAVSSACGGSSGYQPIPVDEARALDSHISAFYSDTHDLFEQSANQVNTVGQLPDGVQARDFELDLVKTALMGCYNTALDITNVPNTAPRGVTAALGNTAHPFTQRPDMDNVHPCNNRELISLESYLDVAPPNVRDFITNRLLTVDTLRVNLKHVLQERLNLLEEYVLDTRGEVARLRDTSTQRYNNAMSNDDVTQDQRLQAEADYEVIQGELDNIGQLCDRIDGELNELRSFRRQLIEDVATNLAAMGQPQS
jgi:hypothetical protein